jgi:hypothetical protein
MGFVLVRAVFGGKLMIEKSANFRAGQAISGSPPTFDAVPPNDFRPLAYEGLGPLPV